MITFFKKIAHVSVESLLLSIYRDRTKDIEPNVLTFNTAIAVNRENLPVVPWTNGQCFFVSKVMFAFYTFSCVDSSIFSKSKFFFEHKLVISKNHWRVGRSYVLTDESCTIDGEYASVDG